MKKKYIFKKPNLSRIFFSRLIDTIFCSAIVYVVSYLYIINSYLTAIIYCGCVFIIYSFYFLIIPCLFAYRCFGKILFNLFILQKDNNEKIKFIMLLKRELYYIFFPYIVLMIAQFLRVYIIINTQDSSNNWAKLLYNLGIGFFVLWSLYLMISIKIQDSHLSSVDLKNRIHVLHKIKFIEPIFYDKNNINKNIDMPGFVDKNNLEEIEKIDYKEIVN